VDPAHTGQSQTFLRGAGLTITILIVSLLLVFLPAYRLFFLISVAIGLGVAKVLYLWHRLKPIKPEDLEHNKRPLGLD
jgi:uncharacterized membrane protein YqjE